MIHQASGLVHPESRYNPPRVHARPTLMQILRPVFPCPVYRQPQVMIPHLRGAAASETHRAAFRNSPEWVSPPLTTGTLPL